MSVGEGPDRPEIGLGKRTDDPSGQFAAYIRDPALEDLAGEFANCRRRWEVINHLRVFLYRKWWDKNGGPPPKIKGRSYRRTFATGRLSTICEEIKVTHPRTAHLDFDWFGNQHWWGVGVDGVKLEQDIARCLLKFLEMSQLGTSSEPPDSPDAWVWPEGTPAGLTPWESMESAAAPTGCKAVRLVWEWDETATAVTCDIDGVSDTGQQIFSLITPRPLRWDWVH